MYITQADYDNLWFSRSDDDLKVSVLGTQDTITVQNWFLGEATKLARIQTGTRAITTENIDFLVQEMAAFSQPNIGAISETASLSEDIKSNVAKLWQART